jgi:glycosyltransferase involved in cell wall biosynthesis
VIVPAYNAEQDMENCLRMLRTQSLDDIEILCVDDGSTDGTARLIHGAAARDRRVRALHQANTGVSAARNTGIDKAQGDYVTFVDTDDELLPHALERLWQAAQGTSSADIVTADHHTVCPNGTKRTLSCPVEASREDIMGALVRCDGRYNAVWNKLYRRGFLLACGLRMPDGMRVGEDVLFNLCAFFRAERWAHVPEPLYLYRLHPGSVMARQKALRYAGHQPMLEAMDAFLRQHHLKAAHYRDFLELHVGLLVRDGARRLDVRARGRVNAGVSPAHLPPKQRALWLALAAGLDELVFKRIRRDFDVMEDPF